VVFVKPWKKHCIFDWSFIIISLAPFLSTGCFHYYGFCSPSKHGTFFSQFDLGYTTVEARWKKTLLLINLSFEASSICFFQYQVWIIMMHISISVWIVNHSSCKLCRRKKQIIMLWLISFHALSVEILFVKRSKSPCKSARLTKITVCKQILHGWLTKVVAKKEDICHN